MARALRIDKQLSVKASLDDVWTKVSTAAGLSTWFADKASADAREGGSIEFTWGSGGTAHRSRAVVLRVHDHAAEKTVMMRWEDTSAHSRDDYFSIQAKKGRGKTDVTIIDFATKDTRDEVDEVWEDCLAKLTDTLGG